MKKNGLYSIMLILFGAMCVLGYSIYLVYKLVEATSDQEEEANETIKNDDTKKQKSTLNGATKQAEAEVREAGSGA